MEFWKMPSPEDHNSVAAALTTLSYLEHDSIRFSASLNDLQDSKAASTAQLQLLLEEASKVTLILG